MNDNTQEVIWPDQKLTENQERVRGAAELIPVSASGTSPENFAQLVDYCKWMSNAKGAVGTHLIGNVGACLAVMEIANKFGMPGYMVARQTYLVNNQIAFMGQLIMAIINKHCPLEQRLKFRFEGEGPELRVIVSGQIKGELEPVEYKSPPFKDIPVKNSPLWKTDPEQQFCYFGARRWQTRYWPEGLFGIYSPDELAENPHLGADNAKVIEGETLKDRLSTADRSEGNKPGHVDAELANIAGNSDKVPEKEPEKKTKAKTPRKPKAAAAALATVDEAIENRMEAARETPAVPEEITEPKTAAQYMIYADAWIEKAKNRDDAAARWDGEYDMRADLTVPIKDRNALLSKMEAKFGAAS